jgi:uncharacterized integral membrane protein
MDTNVSNTMSLDVSRGLWGVLLAILFLVVLQSSLVKAARRRAAQGGRKVKFMDLIITCDDDNYSLSRLQFYLWTIFVVVAFGGFFMATLKIPDITTNLGLLMGVNLSSAVISTAITTWKKTPTQGTPLVTEKKDDPDFVKDIFFESKDSLDLPRTQMFIWTVISLLVFSVMVITDFINKTSTFVDGKFSLPDIPVGLVALTGLSQGAYLGTKAATKLQACDKTIN